MATSLLTATSFQGPFLYKTTSVKQTWIEKLLRTTCQENAVMWNLELWEWHPKGRAFVNRSLHWRVELLLTCSERLISQVYEVFWLVCRFWWKNINSSCWPVFSLPFALHHAEKFSLPLLFVVFISCWLFYADHLCLQQVRAGMKKLKKYAEHWPKRKLMLWWLQLSMKLHVRNLIVF